MFEVGFSELLVISVLALLVLGPAKLPRMAAQVGRWMGRARAMARQFRDQLEQEVDLENITRPSQTSAYSQPTSTPETVIPPAAAIDSNDTGHSDLSQTSAADAPASDVPSSDVPTRELAAADASTEGSSTPATLSDSTAEAPVNAPSHERGT